MKKKDTSDLTKIRSEISRLLEVVDTLSTQYSNEEEWKNYEELIMKAYPSLSKNMLGTMILFMDNLISVLQLQADFRQLNLINRICRLPANNSV